MDKISELQARKEACIAATKEVREKITALVDGESFVELDRYTYSHNDFYEADMIGAGVTMGLATMNDYPVCVAAINPAVLSGGLSSLGCKKIVKCIDKAIAANAPIIYLISSEGLLAGEGVSALEGVSAVLSKMGEASGVIPQFAVCYGKILGSASLFAACADYVYYLKDTCLAFNSPFVISAKSGSSIDKVGGEANGNGIADFVCEDISAVRNGVLQILDILPNYGGIACETGDDDNRDAPSLNDAVCAKCIEKAIFDNGYMVELKSHSLAKEVVTVIGRIGGYSVAALIFNGDEGVELDKANIEKAKNFMYYAADNALPIVTFVNTVGLKADGDTNASTVLTSISQLVCALGYANCVPRINVIYKNAVGLGYTLFASKAFGADYSMAFCNAKIGAVNSSVGAQMEFALNGGSLKDLEEKFASVDMDAMKAAENGYVDNVIEPRYVRQYVIASLQTLV